MNDATAMLAELFAGRWPEDDLASYEINRALRCRPWWPPLPLVWRRQDAGPPAEWDARTAAATTWPDALARLRELHRDYLAARES